MVKRSRLRDPPQKFHSSNPSNPQFCSWKTSFFLIPGSKKNRDVLGQTRLEVVGLKKALELMAPKERSSAAFGRGSSTAIQRFPVLNLKKMGLKKMWTRKNMGIYEYIYISIYIYTCMYIYIYTYYLDELEWPHGKFSVTGMMVSRNHPQMEWHDEPLFSGKKKTHC